MKLLAIEWLFWCLSWVAFNVYRLRKAQEK